MPMLVGEVREAMAGAGYPEVVGRQPVVVRTDEVCEKAPGAPCRRPQEGFLVDAQVGGGDGQRRLIHQPAKGDSSHSSRMGAA